MVNVVLTFAAMGGCILEGELLAIVISDSVGAGVVKNVELSEVSGWCWTKVKFDAGSELGEIVGIHGPVAVYGVEAGGCIPVSGEEWEGESWFCRKLSTMSMGCVGSCRSDNSSFIRFLVDCFLCYCLAQVLLQFQLR